MKPSKTFLCTAAILACASVSQAAITTPQPITFSSGSLAASATFVQSGTSLTVTLANTGGDVLLPTDVLTAVFFDISGGVTLTPVSALLSGGSSVVFTGACDVNPCVGATDVGGEWAYAAGLAGAPGGATKGISSTGLGLFGPGDLFGGTNYAGAVEPDGLQFGITSSGDNLATGNAAVTGANALIKNSVVFTFSGLNALNNYSISNVFFLYGTGLTECNGPCGGGGGGGGVPEPGYLLTLALLGVPVVLRYRKTRQLNA
jgi:hypothetical protein